MPLAGQYAQVLLEEVHFLFQKRAIEVVPQSQIHLGFYSTYFPVPKKTGDLRPILNLIYLTDLSFYQHSKWSHLPTSFRQ